jgi:predicted nuclease with TOPRIM domain
MSDTAEDAAARLWRDRVQIREQERDEAQARVRIAEQNIASLAAENARLCGQNDRLAMEIARLREQNDQLAAEVARLRALRAAEASVRTETEQQVDLRTALQSLLDQPTGSSLH